MVWRGLFAELKLHSSLQVSVTGSYSLDQSCVMSLKNINKQSLIQFNGLVKGEGKLPFPGNLFGV